MPEVVAKITAARAEGMDVTADTYAYTAWFNDFSAFIPAWAHDGGNAKLIERLKDPAMRARIRKDMMTPSNDMGQRVGGDQRPAGCPDRRGEKPKAASAAGQKAV